MNRGSITREKPSCRRASTQLRPNGSIDRWISLASLSLSLLRYLWINRRVGAAAVMLAGGDARRATGSHCSPHLRDRGQAVVPWGVPRGFSTRRGTRPILGIRCLNSRSRVSEGAASIDEARTVGGIRLTIQRHTQSSRDYFWPVSYRSRSLFRRRLFPSQRHVSGFVSP